MTQKMFQSGDWVVYPAHGIGRLECVEQQVIAGQSLDVLVIHFEQNRMTMRLPMARARQVGLRALSTSTDVEQVMQALAKRLKPKKGLWSRRAQEYELKINSGSLTAVADVVRELYRREDEPEPSYSERQVYQSAVDRLVSEIAVVQSIAKEQALAQVEACLRIA